MEIDRREFILAGGALAAGCTSGRVQVLPPVGEGASADGEAPKGALIVSPPVLQNAAETSMGVGFAVSDMANGYVSRRRTRVSFPRSSRDSSKAGDCASASITSSGIPLPKTSGSGPGWVIVGGCTGDIVWVLEN